jgi:hypothetical protein
MKKYQQDFIIMIILTIFRILMNHVQQVISILHEFNKLQTFSISLMNSKINEDHHQRD